MTESDGLAASDVNEYLTIDAPPTYRQEGNAGQPDSRSSDEASFGRSDLTVVSTSKRNFPEGLFEPGS